MKTRRIVMSLGGVILNGIAVALCKLAGFGVDPFQSLVSGLDRWIPISFGTLYMLLNAVLLLFSLCFNRRCIGIATCINLFLLGYITEGTLAVLNPLFPAPGMLVRIAAFILGIGILCIGAALYITADLGVSTYDAVAITMAEKWHVGRFTVLRIVTDCACVLLGILFFFLGGGTGRELGSQLGIGTVLTAFCMGPLIGFFSRTIAKPLLKEK